MRVPKKKIRIFCQLLRVDTRSDTYVPGSNVRPYDRYER